MVKSILLLALMLGMSSAQLSNLPKRYRNENSAIESSTEFGRSPSNNLRKSQRVLEDLSMSMEFSMSVPSIVEEETEPEPEIEVLPNEPIGCNGNEYCPADQPVCECWLFCRFCFFPPCGTCVAE
jgi:hypothetical protein|mmetsp:Transcript_15224/g.32917  ORF Transcript_15224/g.32917 Transcript_15224/m.32917 type:complete len:125 (-) Transcript_15224:182-556(-)